MPKVLIVSFHFEPLEIIASERARSMLKFLPEAGWEVDVLSHDWQKINGKYDPGTVNICKIETLENGNRIIRLGAGNKHRKIQEKSEKSPLHSINILKNWAQGWFDYRAVCRDAHDSMDLWMEKNLKNNYNLIIGIYSPHTHLRLLSKWSKISGIPAHIDFRDLWNNSIASNNPKLDLAQKIQGFFIKRYWHMWLQDSLSMSSVSSSLSNYLSHEYKCDTFTLYTGYDPSQFPKRSANADAIFSIVHAGTLYNNQKIEILLKGIKLFLDQNPINEIEVHFPGLIRPGVTSKEYSYLSNAAYLVKNALDDERVKITERIPVIEARQMMCDASILIKPCFPNDPGIVGGKMFEYLGAGRIIISAPNDHGSIEEIILKSNSGIICDSSAEVAKELQKYFDRWKIDGGLNPENSEESKSLYSSAAQMKLFGHWLIAKIQN